MSTAPIEQGLVDANVRGLLDRLQARADNAYCAYIGLCRRDECLGWEAKVEKGLFGDAELKAHKDAAECLGRHRALQQTVDLLYELLTANAGVKRHMGRTQQCYKIQSVAGCGPYVRLNDWLGDTSVMVSPDCIVNW